MKLFQLSFLTIVLRLYLMMAVVIIAGFTGQWWLSVLALPIFLSCLMAVKIGWRTIKEQITTSRHRKIQSGQKHAAQSAA